MHNYSKYFASSSGWEKYAAEHGYNVNRSQAELPLDLVAGRAEQVQSEALWADKHPLAQCGYRTHLQHVRVRDDHDVEIKTYVPDGPDINPNNLPLLFVCHGGGWIQGTHLTEEAWMLWPILNHLKLNIVSVAYRLAPEHKYPTYITDCWDVLMSLIKAPSTLAFDRSKIILGGSSAGGSIVATLSHMARDKGLQIRGIILNVPVLCDYRHWPDPENHTSYTDCNGTVLHSALLNSADMRQIWDLVVPVDEGKSPQASPFLGTLQGLPPHLIFVAGQDPVRDEGIEYFHKLEAEKNKVMLHIYPGVPHTFAEIWELAETQDFWKDIVHGVSWLLNDPEIANGSKT